jgi:apolipoprotein D and lipocalin family protein
VSFFGPFYGGYHVAALDPDYRWALVLGPDTGYCWILARDKHLDNAQLKQIVARAQALGVDTTSLIWVSQSGTDPVQ